MHFSFLCKTKIPPEGTDTKREKPTNPSKKENLTSENETNISMIGFESKGFQLQGCPDSILLTFTMGNLKIRALKDCGCQLNYVEERWAEQQKFKVVMENFSLTINGFNSSKNLNTRVVEVPVGKHLVEAVCVPKIKISLTLPNLSKIAKAFIQKGYTLADKNLQHLNDKLDNIKFILGTNSNYCLPENQNLFGGPIPSTYSDTP